MISSGHPKTIEETTVSPMKKLFGVLLVAGLAAGPAVAKSEDDVKARTAPVGSTCMSGEECAAAPAPAAAAGPKSGKDGYLYDLPRCRSDGCSEIRHRRRLGAARC